MFRTALLCTALAMAFALPSQAVLINQYNFDDNTANDSVGTRDLNEVGAKASTFASYRSDGNSSNYLAVSGPGGMPDFTVSVWVKTDTVNQGNFKGIFSNMDNTGSFSYQLDSQSGTYRVVSNAGGAFNVGAAVAGEWTNLILQKFGGGDARVYFNGSLVGNLGANPGGLQNFRLGINRNSDNSFDGFIDNVQIWNDSTVDAAAVFAAGPGLTAPEPTTATLGLLGILGLVARRRRA